MGAFTGVSANAARYSPAEIPPKTATALSPRQRPCRGARFASTAAIGSPHGKPGARAVRVRPGIGTATCRLPSECFDVRLQARAQHASEQPGQGAREWAAGAGKSGSEADGPGQGGVIAVWSQADLALVADERRAPRDAVSVRAYPMSQGLKSSAIRRANGRSNWNISSWKNSFRSTIHQHVEATRGRPWTADESGPRII